MAVQKLLGHASMLTTADAYLDWDLDQLAAALADMLKDAGVNRSRWHIHKPAFKTGKHPRGFEPGFPRFESPANRQFRTLSEGGAPQSAPHSWSTACWLIAVRRCARAGTDARAVAPPGLSDDVRCAPPAPGWPEPRRLGGVRRERSGACRRRGRGPRRHAR
jgi:hypothetical protein